MSEESVLTTWTVYQSPLDFPGKIVIRRWAITRTPNGAQPIANTGVALFDDLDQARSWLERMHPGLYCMTRDRDDDPTIVETWI